MYDPLTMIEDVKQDNALTKWVKDQIKLDPFFKEKTQLVATFQRSGREEEAGSTETDYAKDYFNFYFAGLKNGPHLF